jgi:hypothetical protein
MAAEPEHADGGLNPEALPGKGVLGWLGRQVGYVRKAVHHPLPDVGPIDGAATKVYRQTRVEEQAVSDRPNVKLRRTTIDEVVVTEKPIEPPDVKSTENS